MTPNLPILQVTRLKKCYGPPEGGVDALSDVSFDVQRGEFVSIVGPSGCGKSTLFSIIGGLLDADGGSVRIDGDVVDGVHPSIGMVFQEDSTFPWRTAIDNVAFPLEARGVPKPQRLRRARELLHLVELGGFENRYPAELSIGMRQRVALARTLASTPKLMLLDEPFAALDAQTRLLIGDHLLTIHREMQQTTVLITHDLTEAVLLSDRIIILTSRPGRVKRIVDNEVLYPRSSDSLGSDVFARTIQLLWTELRDEVLRKSGVHDILD